MIDAQCQKYYDKLEAAGHKLIRGDDGKIDEFQLDVDMEDGAYGGHNGPRCEICRDTWCVWCHEEPKPCPGRPWWEVPAGRDGEGKI